MPASNSRIELPVAGMTCAACSTRLEKNLNKLPGVKANINLAAEKAQIEYDPDQATPESLIQAIAKTGFSVPPQQLQLSLEGMTCAACATRIENVLNRIEGVTATVNFATETAHISYIPGTTNPELLIAAVSKTGYGAHVSGESSRDAERARRAAVYQKELRVFWLAAALTLPLVGQMGFMFSGHHADVIPR
ncbi:MAG: copper ion binding protein, partial [Sulfuricella sp.]